MPERFARNSVCRLELPVGCPTSGTSKLFGCGTSCTVANSPMAPEREVVVGLRKTEEGTMRTARYLTVMVGALALSASARAQVPMFMGSWNVGIDAGASVPTGGTANVYYAGWTAGAWVGYHAVGAGVSVRGLYRYQHFAGSLSTTPNISMNGLSLEAVGHLPAVYVKPYLLFGVGG